MTGDRECDGEGALYLGALGPKSTSPGYFSPSLGHLHSMQPTSRALPDPQLVGIPLLTVREKNPCQHSHKHRRTQEAGHGALVLPKPKPEEPRVLPRPLTAVPSQGEFQGLSYEQKYWVDHWLARVLSLGSIPKSPVLNKKDWVWWYEHFQHSEV